MSTIINQILRDFDISLSQDKPSMIANYVSQILIEEKISMHHRFNNYISFYNQNGKYYLIVWTDKYPVYLVMCTFGSIGNRNHRLINIASGSNDLRTAINEINVPSSNW